MPVVKYCALALVLLTVGGCAYRDALVLENGEKVDSLYYHESRMPDEVMVEMRADRVRPDCHSKLPQYREVMIYCTA